MGARQSKEELLCQEVQKGNHDAVKALRRDGTSLEWVDKEGRTPLILACTRGELLDMAITLLNLGANINAYRPGTHGGFPIHHAAKRGLEKTVTLLLSRGASPLAINDDGQTPLDMARSRGHVSVVRLLEEQLCLFSGMLRELSGPAILGTLAPTWVTKKIWAVVLPIESNPRRAPRFELAIYQSPKVNLWSGVRPSSSHPSGLCNVAQPRTVIQLAKAEVEEPRMGSRETVLHITDKTSKTKYKFLPENEGNKAQLERLYKACNGIPQIQVGVSSLIHQGFPSPAYQHNNPSQIHPMILHQSGPLSPASQTASAPSSNISSPRKLELPSPVAIPEDVALAIALDASIRSATEEGVPVSPRMTDYNGWGDVSVRSYNSWGLPDPQKPPKQKSYDGWDEGEERSTYDGWGQAEAGPSRPKVASTDTHPEIPATQVSLVSRKEEKFTAKLQSAAANHSAPPSAPPLPSIPAVVVGQIRYPSIDTSSVGMNCSSIQHDESILKGDKKGEDKVSGMCVVCWDAPVEGACIPCGHLAGCMSCLSEVRGKNWGCPVCRAAIEQVVKVYAV